MPLHQEALFRCAVDNTLNICGIFRIMGIKNMKRKYHNNPVKTETEACKSNIYLFELHKSRKHQTSIMNVKSMFLVINIQYGSVKILRFYFLSVKIIHLSVYPRSILFSEIRYFLPSHCFVSTLQLSSIRGDGNIQTLSPHGFQHRENAMRRREFIRNGIAASAGISTLGCSGFNKVTVPSKKVQLWKELSHFSPRPAGTMPTNEIGTTGIRVSQLGFGSHIRKEMVGYDLQREYVIREAHDLGINLFDVYDGELDCHQYEPMGRFLKPIIDDVVISISMKTYEGRTMEQEFERALSLFGRDHIDLVRCHAVSPDHKRWKEHWGYAEKLLRYKEQGKIRAVGVPIHNMKDLGIALDSYPIDYVIFPYNFYHNICWLGSDGDNFDSLPSRLKRSGVGVITMKPFMGDYLVKPFTDIAQQFVNGPEITYPRAALRFVLNSGIKADSTLAGMYSINHLYDDIVAFFEPEMSDEEHELLGKLKKIANRSALSFLPEHYKWLENWA